MAIFLYQSTLHIDRKYFFPFLLRISNSWGWIFPGEGPGEKIGRA
jgi:hypothetical protein